MDIALWLTWRPSAAAHPPVNLIAVSQFAYGMLLGSLGTYSFSGSGFKFVILCFLFAVACVQLSRSAARNALGLVELASTAALLSSFAVVVAVAVGRSSHQGGWNNVLTFHYGYLTVLIPVVSWIVSTSKLSRRACLLASIPAIVLFGGAFIQNAKWRFDYSVGATRQQSQVLADLMQPIGSAQVAEQHILDFYYIDTPQTRSQVASGLATLRALGAPIYGREPQLTQGATINPSLPVTQIGGGACQVAELIGFQEPESWGVWSKQDPATIKLLHSITGPLIVKLTAYVMNDHRPHEAVVTLGSQSKKVTLVPDVPHTFSLTYNLASPVKEIVLSGIKPLSPVEVGLTNDPRKLGIGLVRVECNTSDDHH